MIKVVTAVLLAVLIAVAIWFLPPLGFKLLIVLAAFAGLLEYSRMFFQDPVERWAAVAAGVAASCAMVFMPDAEDVVALLSLLTFAVFMAFMHRTKAMQGTAERTALALQGVLYLGIAFSMWSRLRGVEFGRELVLFALVPACLCDTFGMFVGKAAGRRRLAPLVSPNKTVEGFIGALAGSLGGVFLVWALFLRFIPVWQVVVFSLVIWIVSPMGDLAESMLKRSVGIKDSGSLVPGHGGALDRLDALVFTGPAAYAFVKYIIMP